MKGKGHDRYEQYTAPTSSSYIEPRVQDECVINFSIRLVKIKPGFNSVSVGDFLKVRLESINVLVTYSEDGNACGNIVGSFTGKMVTCMRNGKSFSAKVLNKSGDVQVFNT